MTEYSKDWSPPDERPGVDWQKALGRLVLIFVLLAVAVLLVVGTQNFDERARVRFLLWSWESPLLIFFLISVGLGVAADEVTRLLLRLRRRRRARASGST